MLHLVDFPEGAGEHCVSLNVTSLLPDLTLDDNETLDDSDDAFDTDDHYTSDLHNDINSSETNSSAGNQPQNTDDDQNDSSSSSETITYPLDIEYIVNE